MSLDSRLRGFQSEIEHVDVEASLQAVRTKGRRRILLRRAGMVAFAAAVVALAVTVPIALTDRPTPDHPIVPDPQPSPSLSFHPATPTNQARSIAYVDDRDLFVYDVQTDRATRFTSNGDQRIERDPTFYGDRYIVYAATDPTTIEAVPLAGGPAVTLVQETGSILDLDVAPDGSSIVYIHTDFDGDNTHRLKLVRLDGSAPTILRELGSPPGRGAGSEDEVSVTWSPDGKSILVTDTHIDADPTRQIHWLGAEGGDLIPAWSGTHARWSPDGKTIYYRGHADRGDSRWRALDVATKTRRNLGFREGSNNLAISPDGRYVAYDTSWFGDTPLGTITPKGTPVVYLYDIRLARETVLKSGAVFPIWISPNSLIVTDARPPKPGTSLNSWEPTGTATRLDVDGSSRLVSIGSTAWGDAAALFDVP